MQLYEKKKTKNHLTKYKMKAYDAIKAQVKE